MGAWPVFPPGEIVGDTLIIHIEKADIAYEGIYQVLVNEYAKCFVTPDVRYINREERTWATRGCGARRNRITPCVCSKNIWYAFRYSRRKEKRSCRKSMNF